MKDLVFSITFITLLVLAGTHLSAQVTNQRQTMSRGTNESLILELPSADDKMVADLWPDWLKDNYKVKTKKTKKVKNGELSSLNFSIPGVSAGGKVDMYSVINESGRGSELIIWIATPQGYVSPALSPSQYVEAEKMLMRFALEVSREQIEMDVETEEDKLEDFEKELEKLRKDKEKAEKEIIDARQRIAELEAEIDRNLIEQDNKQREIESQIREVERRKRKLKEF